MSRSLDPTSSFRAGHTLESAVVGAWIFLLYASGACPSIYVGDSGEFVTSAHTLRTPHPVSALFGAGLLAVSPSFWSQANVQRVYALNAFFVVASIAAFLEWRRSRDRRWLAGCFFLCGLGAANHTFMAAQGLALFAAALVETRAEVLRARSLAAIAASILVGLAPGRRRRPQKRTTTERHRPT